MDGVRVRNAAQRHWLAQAARAMEEADRLVRSVPIAGSAVEVADLRQRIDGIRGAIGRALDDVRALERNEFCPEWMRFSAWDEATGQATVRGGALQERS